MTEWVKNWLLGLVGASVCISLISALVPKGTIRSVAQISGGLVMFLVMVPPLLGLQTDELRGRYADYQQQIDEQIELYRQDYYHQMETRIAQETGAYISEKAGQMGLLCHPVVRTREKDGVPLPAGVTMDIPKNEILSVWIAQELDIPEEEQQWREQP